MPEFRQQAMAKASTSEMPAAPLKVVGRSEWLMLMGALLFTLSAGAWGFLGTVPTTVSGSGILLRKAGGTLAVTAQDRAVVEAVMVETGTEVTKGELIVRLRVAAGADKLAGAERKLGELRDQRDTLAAYWTQNFSEQSANIGVERAQALTALRNANQALDAAQSELTAAEKLNRDGLSTTPRLDQARQHYFDTVSARDQLNTKLQDLESSLLALRNKRDQALGDADLAVASAETEANTTRDSLREASMVLAPASGKVTEVAVNTSDHVTADARLLVISHGDTALSALIYMPAAELEWLRPGMEARIAPGTVRPEEYGTALGGVVSVSPYPASEEAMRRFLNNDALVRDLVKAGPRTAIRIDLVSDASTPSGLRWSSGNGPNVLVSEGSLASAEVVVRLQSPASLIIPALRRLTGITAAAS